MASTKGELPSRVEPLRTIALLIGFGTTGDALLRCLTKMEERGGKGLLRVKGCVDLEVLEPFLPFVVTPEGELSPTRWPDEPTGTT